MKQELGKCDYCEDQAVMSVNNVNACTPHIGQAMDKARERMRAVREAFDKAHPRS